MRCAVIITLLLLGYSLPAHAKGGGEQFWGNVAQNYSADQIQIGMSEWQVMNLGLRPDSSNTVMTAQGTEDVWCFSNLGRCVFFLNGSVASIQDNSSGRAAALGSIISQLTKPTETYNAPSQSTQVQTDSEQTEPSNGLIQQSQPSQDGDVYQQQYAELDSEFKDGLITKNDLIAGYADINQRTGQTRHPQ